MFVCSLDDVEVSFKDVFFILHLNSRSSNRNRDNIDVFLTNTNRTFSIIAMSETWFHEDNSNLVDIPNYSLISAPRHLRRSGDSAPYIHNSISYKIRCDLNLAITNTNLIDHSELVFVEIVNSNSENVIVGNVYRTHGTDINLSRCLDTISAKKDKLCYICGYFNLDLLKHDTVSKIDEFLTNFFDHNMFPVSLIDRPTRITSYSATLLDNIFTNVFDNKIKSGIFVSDINDH